MTVLTRHLLRQFRRYLALSLGAFIMVALLVDVIDRIRTLITFHASPVDGVFYFLFKVPMYFYQITPVAACISIILTLGVMNRNREMIALAAGGISPKAVALPLLAACAGVSAIVLLSNEWIMPPSMAASERIWNSSIKKVPGRVRYRTHQIWFRGSGNTVWHVRFLGPEENDLSGVTVFWLPDGGTDPVRRLDAATATWDARHAAWVFSRVTDWRFDAGTVVSHEAAASLSLPFPETPEDFKVMARHPDEMNIGTLSRQIDELAAMGYKTVKLRVQRSVKTAVPFITIVIGTLAVAIGLRSRSFPIGAALALSVTIAVCYWGLLAITIALGNSGVIAPWLAGWVTTLLFAVAGVGALASSLES